MGPFNTGRTGTLEYMAPEVQSASNNDKWNGSADIWSLGVTFFEMFFSHFPDFSENGRIQQFQDDTFKLIFDFPQFAELQDLLENMLRRNPEQRISIDNIINHPFFDRICW